MECCPRGVSLAGRSVAVHAVRPDAHQRVVSHLRSLGHSVKVNEAHAAHAQDPHHLQYLPVDSVDEMGDVLQSASPALPTISPVLVYTPFKHLRAVDGAADLAWPFALLFRGVSAQPPNAIDYLPRDEVDSIDGEPASPALLSLLGFHSPDVKGVWLLPREPRFAYDLILNGEDLQQSALMLQRHLRMMPHKVPLLQIGGTNASSDALMQAHFLHLNDRGPSQIIPPADPAIHARLSYLNDRQANECNAGEEHYKSIYPRKFDRALNDMKNSSVCGSHAKRTKPCAAYVILSYSADMWNLPTLMEAIYSAEDFYYIHVDRSVSGPEFTQIKAKIEKHGSNVLVDQQLRGCWGCPSLSYMMILGLIRVSLMSDRWTHVAFVSASSFPTQNVTKYRQYLFKNQHNSFMDLEMAPHDHYEYRFFTKWQEYSELNGEHFICPLTRTRGDIKIGNYAFKHAKDFYKSEQWITLNYTAAAWMLCSGILIDAMDFFHHSLISDEHLFASVMGNSQFKEWIKPSLMYVVWDNCQCGDTLPCQMCDKEVPLMKAQKEKFFARKFVKKEVVNALLPEMKLPKLAASAKAATHSCSIQ
eukprot:NODE_264_length_2059_cov_39.578607_g180_i0.p1 GENE.NODE_264_length_2059_cov_39.578607_g180_i0~~NODE_264_length_2059_cov_39.578607_g180_i0.p1  ORF type:complete len:606 (+),score=133.42 NODE_264_length_2059_cov_39.578607_g180_i0:58-1818(+)